MNSYILLFLFFVLGSSSPTYKHQEVSTGFYKHKDNVRTIQKFNASNKDIVAYFRSRTHRDMTQIEDIYDSAEVDNLGFEYSKDTVFIVHGWHNEYDSPFNEVVSTAILETKDVNIFIIDWHKLASGLYITAFDAVPDVGVMLGALISNLATNNKLNLDKSSIVGHSLGAHVAGLAGQALKGKINHILGLDPALPLFSYDDIDKRLDTTDAKFVEVIHTCAGLLGFNVDIGHSDYYPNGGRDQPGCGIDLAGTCAHSRSYLYYSESLTGGGFVSQKCDNYKDYKNKKCSGEKSNMGEINIDKSASGAYYLDTNDKSPFARHDA